MDIDKIFQYLTAKSEPSPDCKDGKEHAYKTVGHSDGPKSYSWIFECERCGDIYRHEVERKGKDLEIWDSD